MHMFVPRNRVGIFRTERNRSIPLELQNHVLGRFALFLFG
jgi:hypothetical protein